MLSQVHLPPFPTVDMSAANPLLAMVADPAFRTCQSALEALPGAGRSLLSAPSRALIYSLVRNMKPQHVVEIGTFRGGTAEAICIALAAPSPFSSG